jgi:hypothetical protein
VVLGSRDQQCCSGYLRAPLPDWGRLMPARALKANSVLSSPGTNLSIGIQRHLDLREELTGGRLPRTMTADWR